MVRKIEQLQEWFQLYKEYDGIFHDLALKMGLSDSAFLILYGICYLGDGCLQKDICAHYTISKQTVNSSTRRLVQEGFLTLKSGSGRDMHLCLTPKGEAFAQKYIYPVIDIEEEAFLEMSPQERDALVRLTHRYVSLMREKADQLMK